MSYSDPNFWQIVGVITAFLIMAITLYVQRSRKSLAFKVLTETSLISIGEELKGKLQVTLDGASVKNVHLVIIKVWNNGNVSIAKSDFEKPMLFSFSEQVNILSAKIIEKTPQSLEPNLALVSSNQFSIEPLLLNRQDSFTVKLLVADYLSKLSINARLNGVKDIKRVESIFASFRWKASITVLLMVVIIVLISGLLFPSWLEQGTKGIGSLVITVLAAIIGLLSSIKNFVDVVKEQDKVDTVEEQDRK
jgi:hypothetical protein